MPRKPKTKVTVETDEDEVDVEVEETADDELEVEDDTEAGDEDETDDVDDLEVEDSDDEEEPAPKKGRTKKAAADKPAKAPREEIQFGSAWLAEHVNAATGSNYNAFGIRTLLRKLVKDGVVQRDVGTDRSRYSFEGPNDATVKAVVKAIKDGSAAKAKAEKIEEAKTAAAKKTAKPAAKKAKAAPEPEVEDEDDEDIEDL